MFDQLRNDIKVVLERDPAARSKWEVLFAYPGIHALIFHRAAHWLWKKDLYALARFTSHISRFLTSIEIHPAAKIGEGVFIDHGVGVVIGETAEVGDNVTLYQGVTLGGTSLEKTKRHPTLEEGVIVGAGAKILGPMTVGKNARIGSNAVVLSPVPENATMLGIPAKVVQTGEAKPSVDNFCAYGMDTTDMPDPVARSLEGMFDMVCGLRSRVEDLEKELTEKDVQIALLRDEDDDEQDEVATKKTSNT